jgi:hypothetical protein
MIQSYEAEDATNRYRDDNVVGALRAHLLNSILGVRPAN